jgi:hypothetical protein
LLVVIQVVAQVLAMVLLAAVELVLLDKMGKHLQVVTVAVV